MLVQSVSVVTEALHRALILVNVSLCMRQVKDLDDSGRGQRSIEWRKRAIYFCEDPADQDVIRRQIARAALKMGDLETASSYMDCLQQASADDEVPVKIRLDNRILALQIAAKAGD